MQAGKSSEADFFQRIARNGFAKGTQGQTQQGIYIFTPGGELLYSDNTREPARFLRGLELGLEAWNRLPEARRGGTGPGKTRRGEDFYPKDGLVLRMFSRDLGTGTRAIGDQDNLWNTDMVWLTKGEMQGFVPKQIRPGAVQEIPQSVVRRLARLHLIDSVLGQPRIFQNNSVQRATLRAEITGVKGTQVELRLQGATSAREGDRSVQTQIFGNATYDTAREKFIAFEMVATGSRQGIVFRQPYIRNETGSGEIGFAFLLGSEAPADRVAPSYFPAYGW